MSPQQQFHKKLIDDIMDDLRKRGYLSHSNISCQDMAEIIAGVMTNTVFEITRMNQRLVGIEKAIQRLNAREKRFTDNGVN